MNNLTVTVHDKNTGETVKEQPVDSLGTGLQLAKIVYRSYSDRSLTLRIETDLDDTCLEW
jgi:hypothetical protein